MDKLKPYRKAIVGALAAGLTALGTALADGQVTGEEWTRVAVAAVVSLGIVYAVPNRPADGPQIALNAAGGGTVRWRDPAGRIQQVTYPDGVTPEQVLKEIDDREKRARP